MPFHNRFKTSALPVKVPILSVQKNNPPQGSFALPATYDFPPVFALVNDLFTLHVKLKSFSGVMVLTAIHDIKILLR
jgi:hypothetical protein